MKIILSCPTKFWAFNLAEQLQKKGMLDKFLTTYSYNKNTWLRRFSPRVDNEKINNSCIVTNPLLAVMINMFPRYSEVWIKYFDRWVARKLNRFQGDVFIGWSGMSLESLRVARSKNMVTILERGSAHISYQSRILSEEAKINGQFFKVSQKLIDREKEEYQLADYIAIPSQFVKRSFVDEGITPSKLIVNHYGSGSHFRTNRIKQKHKYRIVYLGGLMNRKGLIYLFKALCQVKIPISEFDVWFIGGINKEVEGIIHEYQEDNWKFWGHVDHYKLPELLQQCSVGVIPSIEDGFGMVVPQLLSSGIPVITTVNTGGADLIDEDENGYILPIRHPEAIMEKIEHLYHSPDLLERMSLNALKNTPNLTWDDYGDRYVSFLNSLAS